MNTEDLRDAYRRILDPPFFERVLSFLFRFRLDPLARDVLRTSLAVFDSMTPSERTDPALVNESQIDRIALGSGTSRRTVRSVLPSLTQPRRRQRGRLLASPFPRQWQEILHDRVWQYPLLEIEQRDKLHGCVKTLVAEVDWVGLDGHYVNDAMKVTIAGHASLMLLGFENDFMDEIRTIRVCRQEFDDNGASDPIYATDTKAGQAHSDGTTILSWHHVLNANYYGDYNLVIHEFAHHFDRRDGQMNATLSFKDARDQERWDRVVAEEFAELRDAASSGRWTLLRHYGAKNRSEFFAVATECFFESPDRLRRSHAELYDLLRRYYNLDTVRWLA